MVGKTNVAGARLRAVIAVTYPEGSVCTCSNGTKTLKARDTSGKALFNVPLGEWTVSCTDGTNTSSKAVSITSEGQSESVTLRYELIIYENNSFPSAAGEIVSAQRVTITKYETYFDYTKSSSDYAHKACTENPIDLTLYNSLKISCARNGSGWGNGVKFGVNDSALSPNVSLSGAYVVIPDYGNKDEWSDIATYSVVISEISGEKYIGFDGQDNNLRIYKIWLE